MILVILLLGIVLIVVLVRWQRDRRIARELQAQYGELEAQIERFLQDAQYSLLALDDSNAAGLQTAISRLEDRILQTQIRLHDEQERNHHFIADISHQLKTPLSALRLYAELSNDAYREKELVLIDRMEKLIFQLLRIEKLRSGSYPLQFADQSLHALVSEAWQEIESLYPAFQVTMDGDQVLRADGFWLKEAFRNIMKNTCERDPEHKVIQVDIRARDAMVQVSFEDYAGGVPATMIGQLFDRFNRSASEVSSRNSGLGLAICKTIAECHHGSIYAENTHHGLRVMIYLPIQEGYRSY